MTVSSNKQLASTEPLLWAQKTPAVPVHNHTHTTALDCLGKAFVERQPLTVMLSDGKSGAAYLIDRFLDAIEDEVTVVRISEPCPDADAGMRKVIHAIGFDSKGMSLTDLENVFAMFLGYQRTHNRRTILCMEESQDYGQCLLDAARRLVDLETESKLGLMVILSGRPSMHKLLDDVFLNSRGAQVEERIALAPFTLAETRSYLRWRIESKGTENIADVIEFDAVTLIHELGDGMPDAVSELCAKCLQLASEESVAPATTSLVRKSNELLQLPSATQHPDTDAGPAKVNGVSPKSGRLIARIDGEVVKDRPLNRGHILIGRDKLCDIRISSPPISRQHALLVNSSNGIKILDLGSTNGTFVDGRPIKECVLEDRGVIGIGDYKIEYVADDDRQGWIFDIQRIDGFDPHNVDYGTEISTAGGDHNGSMNGGREKAAEGRFIKGNINSKGERIYHAPGTPAYSSTKIDESKGERWFCSEEEARAAGWRAPRK